jgi:hypothetical protein
VSPLSLASVLMGRTRKPLVRSAYDFAAWADGQGRRRKDVVAGYRNWLDNTNDLAGIEPLDDNGSPGGAVVTPIRPRHSGGHSVVSDLLIELNGGLIT